MTPEDEHKRLKEASDGAAAKRLMEDPMLVEAFESIRQGLTAAWEGESNPARREDLWHELHGLRSIWAKLKARVTTGQMAEQQLRGE